MGNTVTLPLGVQGSAAGFVVLLPSAAPDARRLPQHWRNDTTLDDPLEWLHLHEGAAAPDDVAFIWAAAACTRDVLRIPLSGRVHATGWSQGAKMASGLAGALACAPHNGFAIASVAAGAGLFDPLAATISSAAGCAAAAATPLLIFQGGADVIVPFCDTGFFYKAGKLIRRR
jgi:poly(3-hydroxybutyrate) depolymerase